MINESIGNVKWKGAFYSPHLLGFGVIAVPKRSCNFSLSNDNANWLFPWLHLFQLFVDALNQPLEVQLNGTGFLHVKGRVLGKNFNMILPPVAMTGKAFLGGKQYLHYLQR